jgi:acyl transferase domain-containing protein
LWARNPSVSPWLDVPEWVPGGYGQLAEAEDHLRETAAAGLAVGMTGWRRSGPGSPARDPPALLAAALGAAAALDAFGVRPVAGVGYGLAEITALAWAGCIPVAEAARLLTQCAQVLRACGCAPGAMARVTADAASWRALPSPRRGAGWSPPSPAAWSRRRMTWPGCWQAG